MSFSDNGPPPSSHSKYLKRDTYIYVNLAPTLLLFGLNQSITHASMQSIRRWCCFINKGPSQWKCGISSTQPPPQKEWDLRPIKFQRMGIMTWAIDPDGDIIPRESTHSIPPGNYVCFLVNEFKGIPAALDGYGIRLYNFNQMPDYIHAEKIESLYDFSKNIIHDALASEALRKSSGHCHLTDDMCDVAALWIFPPAYGELSDRYLSGLKPDYDPENYRVAANVVVMRRDLHNLFWDNAFSFDPTDEYKVVCFRDMRGLEHKLPKCLNIERLAPGASEYLNMHFYHSLVVNVHSGGINWEYTTHRIMNTMNELGVGLERDSDQEMVPLDDERWVTPIGKEILTSVMGASIHEDE